MKTFGILGLISKAKSYLQSLIQLRKIMLNKKVLLLFLFWIQFSVLVAQDQKVADSLAIIYYQNNLTDTARFKLLEDLSYNEIGNLKKGLEYADELIQTAQQAGNLKYVRKGYFLKGTKQRMFGNTTEAFAAYFKCAALARQANNTTAEGECYGAIGDTYSVDKNHVKAMEYYNKAITILRQSNDSISLASYILNAGDEYLKNKNFDSALLYFEEAKVIFSKKRVLNGMRYSLGAIGMVYANIGKNMLAEKNMNEAIKILEEAEDYYPICDYLTSLADIYSSLGDNEKALDYNMKSLQLAERYGLKEQIANASLKLSELYETQGDMTDALSYYKKHIVFKDSIYSVRRAQEIARLETQFAVAQKQIEIDLLNQKSQSAKRLTFSLVIILVLTVVIIGILLKYNKNKQRAYQVLNLQKQETENQKAKAEQALNELQIRQKQLVQSAKMASLGELTAGIAHEIQNPLNFVNNFSDLSVDLLGELKEETVNKLSPDQKTQADEIINVLADNLKKISEHGKRADLIVKGMLQHSTTSTGNREPSDINALADEYLRLSYHGLRAKDKSFTAQFSTHFDTRIGKIDIVPQDMGRVLLNLYNNAFYAVNKKKMQGDSTYIPTVSVTTKKVGNTVEIAIKDNGIGMPGNILDKIFHPFFTTKPSGQGTGLGLSLSYDIVKAMGGDFKVETKEGEFTEFIIQIPMNNG